MFSKQRKTKPGRFKRFSYTGSLLGVTFPSTHGFLTFRAAFFSERVQFLF